MQRDTGNKTHKTRQIALLSEVGSDEVINHPEEVDNKANIE